MTPKTDLFNKINELEGKLQLIYKYKPSFQYIEESLRVLQSIGLEEDKIHEVISRGTTYVIGSITNPINNEKLAISVEDIAIKEDKNTGQYVVFIGSLPYKEFFAQELMTTRKIEELAKEHPEIKTLYEENRRLKKDLSLFCRKMR